MSILGVQLWLGWEELLKMAIRSRRILVAKDMRYVRKIRLKSK